MAEQVLGLLAHQVTHPPRAGLHRIIVVDDSDRLSRRSGRAINAAGLGNQAFGLRIVDVAQFVLVIEVLDGAAMRNDGQAFDV